MAFGVVKTPTYMAMNPNALVPTLQDGDFTLWESNAIVRYLCAKYGNEHACTHKTWRNASTPSAGWTGSTTTLNPRERWRVSAMVPHASRTSATWQSLPAPPPPPSRPWPSSTTIWPPAPGCAASTSAWPTFRWPAMCTAGSRLPQPRPDLAAPGALVRGHPGAPGNPRRARPPYFITLHPQKGSSCLSFAPSPKSTCSPPSRIAATRWPSCSTAAGLNDAQMQGFARWTNLSGNHLPAATHARGSGRRARTTGCASSPPAASCPLPATPRWAAATPGWRPAARPRAKDRHRARARRRGLVQICRDGGRLAFAGPLVPAQKPQPRLAGTGARTRWA